jgi:tetratricopeptide (TPR) repeat protein
LEQLGYSRQDVARTFFSRGCLHLAANRNRQASQDLRFSLQLDASQEWVAINLGVALTRLGDTKEAIDVFRQCLSGQPQRVEGWVGLGNALYATKSYAEAEAAYARALAIDPGDSAVLLNRANAREQLGDIIGAAEDVAAAERVLQSSARH